MARLSRKPFHAKRCAVIHEAQRCSIRSVSDSTHNTQLYSWNTYTYLHIFFVHKVITISTFETKITFYQKVLGIWKSEIHCFANVYAVLPVSSVKCLCSRGWEWGREATPSSISIFDFYGIKTLWFGNDIFTGNKMPTL